MKVIKHLPAGMRSGKGYLQDRHSKRLLQLFQCCCRKGAAAAAYEAQRRRVAARIVLLGPGQQHLHPAKHLAKVGTAHWVGTDALSTTAQPRLLGKASRQGQRMIKMRD